MSNSNPIRDNRGRFSRLPSPRTKEEIRLRNLFNARKFRAKKGRKIKICKLCGIKIENAFNSQDYHKDCLKIRRKEYSKQYRKDRSKHYAKLRKRWLLKNPDKLNNIKHYRANFMVKWRKENADLVKIYNLSSKIKIPKYCKCELCHKRLAKEKHHPDYSRPLNVIFVCIKCHKEVHKNG